jgi:hypothetical protein
VRDPDAIRAITTALQQAHGDEAALAMLARGVTLATVLQAVLSGPMSNREAVRLIARSLSDFAISPDVGPLFHVKYVYGRVGSFDVADMVVATPAGNITIAEVTLRLAV